MFAVEQKVLEPGSRNVVLLEVNMRISKDFFGKIYPRSGLLSGYRGIVKIIMVNHSKVPYQVCIGERIAQIIFHKIEKTTFQKVDAFSSSERQFGVLGLQDINFISLF